MRARHMRATGAALVLGVALTTSACGGSSTGADASSAAPSAKNSAAAKLLPAKVRSQGYLTVGTDATYPPMESIDTDGKTIVGLDPDLAKALGKELGITFRFTNSSFDAIIPGMAAGKYDIGFSGFNDTPERRKTLDFVDYYAGGSSFFTTSDGPDVTGLKDVCGHSVAVQKGTVQADDLAAQSTKCTAAGKAKVVIQVYPDQTAANLSLKSGRAQLSVADSPVAAYQVQKSKGAFRVVGAEYGVAMHGIAVPRTSGLTKALTQAMGALISDGTYVDVLKKYGLEKSALTAPQVNSAPVS